MLETDRNLMQICYVPCSVFEINGDRTNIRGSEEETWSMNVLLFSVLSLNAKQPTVSFHFLFKLTFTVSVGRVAIVHSRYRD